MIPVTDHDTQKEKEIYYKQTQQVGQSQVSIAIFTSIRRTGYFTIKHKIHWFEEYSSIKSHAMQCSKRKT